MSRKTPAPLQSLVQFACVAARRFHEDRCMQIASSLTFTTLLALVPLITVALTVFSAFPVFGTLTEHLHEFLLENMLPESVDLIASYTEQFTANAAKLTAVGVAVLAVTAIMLLVTIDHAFNQIWRVPRPRTPVQRIFIYWALLTVGPVLLGASLSLTSWLVSVSLGLVSDIPGAGIGLLRTIPVVLIWFAFALLYLTMPNRRILVKDAAFGGLLAALAFEAMKRGFAIYITQFPTYKLVYGAFASVPIFLLWIYLSWLVVLSGALVVAVLPEWRERAWQAEPAPGTQFFDALHILKLLWRAHRSGEVLLLGQLHAAVKLRADGIEAILDAMSDAHWVGKVGAGWALIRDAEEIRVADVYHLFVFRAGAKLPAREADPELDKLAREIAGRIGENMQTSVEHLFESAAQPDAPAAPARIQAV